MNNKTSAAEAVLLKAIDIEETVASFNNLGVAYYKLSKYEEACKYFEKSHYIAYKKDYSFRPYLNLGMSFTKLKKKKEAEEFLGLDIYDIELVAAVSVTISNCIL